MTLADAIVIRSSNHMSLAQSPKNFKRNTDLHILNINTSITAHGCETNLKTDGEMSDERENEQSSEKKVKDCLN